MPSEIVKHRIVRGAGGGAGGVAVVSHTPFLGGGYRAQIQDLSDKKNRYICYMCGLWY